MGESLGQDHDPPRQPRGPVGSGLGAARQKTGRSAARGSADAAMRLRRRRHQVTLQLMVGAELWVRVEHGQKHFKVPAHVSIWEVFTLVSDGVSAKPLVKKPARKWLQLEEWADLIQHRACLKENRGEGGSDGAGR